MALIGFEIIASKGRVKIRREVDLSYTAVVLDNESRVISNDNIIFDTLVASLPSLAEKITGPSERIAIASQLNFYLGDIRTARLDGQVVIKRK